MSAIASAATAATTAVPGVPSTPGAKASIDPIPTRNQPSIPATPGTPAVARKPMTANSVTSSNLSSGQSKKVPTTVLNSSQKHRGGSRKAGSGDGSKNPFRMPTDDEVFAMREADRQRKAEQKIKNLKMQIHEKTKQKARNMRQLLALDAEETAFAEALKMKQLEDVSAPKGIAERNFGKENLQDLVSKKREMFFLQYALGVKRDEITKLEEIAQAEEQKLLEDEKALEEDAAKFDAFLKENDKNSVEAIKKAEAETKAKLEKVQEIKKLNAQIMAIRSEMSKNEDQLRDYKRYRAFLERLTPAEWFVEHPRKNGKLPSSLDESRSSAKKKRTSVAAAEGGKKSGDATDMNNNEDPLQEDDEDLLAVEDEIEEADMYFKHPQQLLDIFAELEETNLSLIQSCQETEETLEELRKNISETEAKMEKETASLRQQIDNLNSTIAKEEDKAASLEDKCSVFVSGFGDAEAQDKLLEELNQRVKEAYRKCFNDNDTSISTLQMLTSIENKLEHLFEVIEMMHPDKVEQAERFKDRERRQRLREQKMEAQRILQEERVQKALERARAPVKKKTGKPVVFRSAPPQRKKKQESEGKKKEEEDLAYYLE